MSSALPVISKRRSRGRLVAGIIAGLLLGLVLAVVGLVLFGSRFLPSIVQSGEREITSDTIQSSFESIAELSVEEYNFTNIGRFTEDNSRVFGLDVPFTGSMFLITYDGTVKAGLRDFTAADVNVDDAAQTITLTLPRTEVLSSTIDPNSVEQYDQSFNPINQIQVSDMAEFLATEESRAEQTAVDNGLLDRAESRTEELLTRHVEAFSEGSNLANYSVEVK